MKTTNGKVNGKTIKIKKESLESLKDKFGILERDRLVKHISNRLEGKQWALKLKQQIDDFISIKGTDIDVNKLTRVLIKRNLVELPPSIRVETLVRIKRFLNYVGKMNPTHD